jgi:CO dehydrogenase/acetyl-CoA synthase gamma subunit (corrinoid Fe-S protein)
MARLKTVVLAATLLLSASAVFHASTAQEKRWAAIDPNSETTSPVAWSSTEAKARQEAVEACKRGSTTCANGPASTSEMADVFAVMCCTKPRRGCAVGVAGARQDALKSVQKTFADAGYSNCSLRHYLSAASGKKD